MNNSSNASVTAEKTYLFSRDLGADDSLAVEQFLAVLGVWSVPFSLPMWRSCRFRVSLIDNIIVLLIQIRCFSHGGRCRRVSRAAPQALQPSN